MLVASVLAAAAVFGCLMAVDWYVWDPRLRRSNALRLDPEDRNGKHQMLRNAA